MSTALHAGTVPFEAALTPIAPPSILAGTVGRKFLPLQFPTEGLIVLQRFAAPIGALVTHARDVVSQLVAPAEPKAAPDLRSTGAAIDVSDAEARALADFALVNGRIIAVTTVSGYVGDTVDQDDRTAPDGEPFRVRVVATSTDELAHRNDDYLDPYWNVEPADGETRLAGLRSTYTFGRSYRIGNLVR